MVTHDISLATREIDMSMREKMAIRDLNMQLVTRNSQNSTRQLQSIIGFFHMTYNIFQFVHYTAEFNCIEMCKAQIENTHQLLKAEEKDSKIEFIKRT